MGILRVSIVFVMTETGMTKSMHVWKQTLLNIYTIVIIIEVQHTYF